MTRFLMGVLGLILALSMACSRKADHMTGYDGAYTDPDVPIEIASGREFSIRLESNPTTGYQWRLACELGGKTVLVTNVFVPAKSGLMGAGGHEVWVFRAAHRGGSRIEMKYVRPWEEHEPYRTNVFTVMVK